MKKLFASVLFTAATFLNAGVVDAIALTVNDDAITLYDIDAKLQQTNGDKQKAVGMLVDDLLYEQELSKNNITATMFDINNYLEKLAAQNGLELYAFKSIIRQKYKDYSVFEEEIKKRILREKLVAKLVRGNVKVASDEDLKIYYENNKSQYATASKYYVSQYASKTKASLLKIIKNPMLALDDVSKQDVVLEHSKINAQIKYILNNTNTKAFTPIFTANKHYVTLFISKKEGEEIKSFEESKQNIFNALMGQREQKFLKEYFEKLKLTADIKVIR